VLVLTQLLNLLLVPFFGHAGLALSIGCGALINAAWLFFGLRRAGAYTPLPGWAAFAVRVLVATALLAALLAWGARWIDWVGLHGRPWFRVGWLAAFLLGAAVLYFSALLAMGIRPKQFVHRG